MIRVKNLEEKAPQLYLGQKLKKILEAPKLHENLLNHDQFHSACLLCDKQVSHVTPGHLSTFISIPPPLLASLSPSTQASSSYRSCFSQLQSRAHFLLDLPLVTKINNWPLSSLYSSPLQNCCLVSTHSYLSSRLNMFGSLSISYRCHLPHPCRTLAPTPPCKLSFWKHCTLTWMQHYTLTDKRRGEKLPMGPANQRGRTSVGTPHPFPPPQENSGHYL